MTRVIARMRNFLPRPMWISLAVLGVGIAIVFWCLGHHVALFYWRDGVVAVALLTVLAAQLIGTTIFTAGSNGEKEE